jgi:hypothetical protein
MMIENRIQEVEKISFPALKAFACRLECVEENLLT